LREVKSAVLRRDTLMRDQVASGRGKGGNRGGSEEEPMTMNDLPAIMGVVLIVAGLALVCINTWVRTDRSEKTTQVGALIIVVGAFLLGLSIFVPRAK
jgi:hypothetical protein